MIAQGLWQTSLSVQDATLGDFNAKCTDWLPGTSTNAAGTILSNLLASFDLHQMVSEVTRPSGGQGLPSVHGDGTLLDLIITNRPAFFGAPSILPALGSSDHFTVHCTFDACTPNQRRPLVRLWNVNRCDQKALLYDLSMQPWPSNNNRSCSDTDIDSLWENWHSLFMSCVQKHVPSKLVKKVRPKPPWLYDNLIAECKLKKSLFRLSKSSPTPENIARFRMQRNKVTALLRRAWSFILVFGPPLQRQSAISTSTNSEMS